MKIDTLLFAIIQRADADTATGALTRAGFGVTRVSSVGGFLQTGNVTLMLGLARADLARATQTLAANCHQRTVYVNAAPPMAGGYAAAFIAPIEAQVGGATIFALPVERFIRIGANEPARAESTVPEQVNGMKLILAIVPDAQTTRILDALTRADYRATRLSTTGGFWRRGNTTLLIGVATHQVDDALARLRAVCRADGIADSPEACATIFVLDVARFERV